jgi:hypothetical protein
LEAPLEQAWFSADPRDGIAQFTPEMGAIDAAQSPQLNPFELRPEALPRIQLRGGGGQAFHVHPLRRTMGQDLLHELAAMHRGPVPDEHDPAWHLTQEVFQAGHHIR